MNLEDKLAGYNDIREIGDKALASEKGIRIQLETHGRAIHLRQKFYRFRSLIRQQIMKVYEPVDSAYGGTPYDELTVSIEENTLFLKKVSINLEVEEL